MSLALEVFSDLSERIKYNISNFPLYVRKGTLIQFDRYTAACHWHPDLEFILVLDGSMEYFVNGQTVHVDKGNGIFINSKRLHYGFSNTESDCSYIVVAVHPILLGEGTSAGKLYLEDKFGSNTNDFIFLSSQNIWQQEVLFLIKQIYDEIHSSSHNLLRLLSTASSLCAHISEHLKQIANPITDEQSWIIIRKMTGYIHQYFDHKITLKDISAAGTVCRSRCCELFNKYIGQTPNTYLTQYRIQKSCEMLRETNRSVCEIGLACGFQNPSYFSYTFHKIIGLIPQDFRKKSTTGS